MEVINSLLSPANLFYLFAVILAPIVVRTYFLISDYRTRRRRVAAGLPEQRLLGPAALLAGHRARALVESFAIFNAIIWFPVGAAFLAWGLKRASGNSPVAVALVEGLEFPTDLSGWKIATGLMLVGFGFAASDVIKSYVSGLLFFTAITMRNGMQAGDRVTVSGQTGRIKSFGPLFVQLITESDDLVTLPTSKLWSEAVVSANAGDRSSLCVMEFLLAPTATSTQQKIAEDTIWEAVQASVYADLEHPIQIYYAQKPNAILIIARAYVANTYREPEFKSDVMRAFLEVCSDAGIPLSHEGMPGEPQSKYNSSLKEAA